MAKYERRLTGNFHEVLLMCEEAIVKGSISASFEAGSDFRVGEARVSVRVYERFSYLGGNRVSLNMTLAGEGNDLYLSAITSGGSQAMFFKINTIGEENFLSTLKKEIERKFPYR